MECVLGEVSQIVWKNENVDEEHTLYRISRRNVLIKNDALSTLLYNRVTNCTRGGYTLLQSRLQTVNNGISMGSHTGHGCIGDVERTCQD